MNRRMHRLRRTLARHLDLPGHRDRDRARDRRSTSFRLAVEGLEGRAVPASLTWTGLAIGGDWGDPTN